MQTYNSGRNGQIWGGVRTYAGHKYAEVLAAVAHFTSEGADPKAAIIPTFNFASGAAVNIPFILVTFFYDDFAPPPAAFEALDRITPLTDDTRARSFESLTREILAGNMKGLRFRIGVNSFPAMPAANMSAFLKEHYELVRDKAVEAAKFDPLDFKVFSFAVQPMPVGIAAASRAKKGGNALGLDPDHGDKVWIEYDLAWLSPVCDSVCTDWIKSAVRDAHELHARKYSGIYPTNYKSGDLETIR